MGSVGKCNISVFFQIKFKKVGKRYAIGLIFAAMDRQESRGTLYTNCTLYKWAECLVKNRGKTFFFCFFKKVGFAFVRWPQFITFDQFFFASTLSGSRLGVLTNF